MGKWVAKSSLECKLGLEEKNCVERLMKDL